MVVTTAQHTAQHTAPATREGPAQGRVRRQEPPVGSGHKALLPPEVATAIGARRRFRTATTTQTDPPRTDPPLRGATPEIESVDRDAIRVVATLRWWIYDRVSFQD
jgi:hypothetical protein